MERVTRSLRGVISDLRPPVLDRFGVAAALRWYGEQCAERFGVAVEVQAEALEPPPPEVGMALFRVAQEALLLGLSRVTRAELRSERVDLSAMARSITERLRQGEPGRRVAAVIADGLEAEGDRLMLEQVLENLLGNAWKFTGPRAAARIEVGAVHQGGGPVFFVEDNGVGFDMRCAGKLFVPFQRLHSMNEFPGTGVGLSTVHRVVTRHGGRVWAHGEVGGGTRISFSLHDTTEDDHEP